MAKRVGLVGCVKQKRRSAAPARDLYTSTLFKGRRTAVEATCDEWFVLSALHGLVRPDERLDPYDKTLNSLGHAERRRWSTNVLRDLETHLGALQGIHFELHAGATYLEFGLRDGLLRRGATVSWPTRGLAMGQQLQYYSGAGR